MRVPQRDRSPIALARLEAYATGEWTQLALLHELTRRGLDVPGTRSKPAKPLTLNSLANILTNPYYKGIVSFQGVEYEGRHQPLVSADTWQRVQEVMTARREIRVKERTHPHYLKGIYCGRCGSRMLVTHAKSRTGRSYPYFVCSGRHEKRTDCTMKAVRIETVEDLVFEASSSEDLHLMLDSPGGDGETAVRLVRSAQARCRELTIIVPNQAKSVATLLAMGAHHILMGPTSDLGPVDPQFPFPNPSGRGLYSAKDLIAAVARKAVALKRQEIASEHAAVS